MKRSHDNGFWTILAKAILAPESKSKPAKGGKKKPKK